MSDFEKMEERRIKVIIKYFSKEGDKKIIKLK